MLCSFVYLLFLFDIEKTHDLIAYKESINQLNYPSPASLFRPSESSELFVSRTQTF